MTNAQLDDKFRHQAVLSLPTEQVDQTIALCWRLADLPDVAELVNAAVTG